MTQPAHRAITTIRGNVVSEARCHSTKTGVVANFTVRVTTPWGKGPTLWFHAYK